MGTTLYVLVKDAGYGDGQWAHGVSTTLELAQAADPGTWVGPRDDIEWSGPHGSVITAFILDSAGGPQWAPLVQLDSLGKAKKAP